MAWDFSTDPDWAEQLAWVEDFVRAECEPIDLIVKESHDLNDPVRQALIPPLQQIVKERGLWATHLGAHLGGPGYGQMKLALLNEILGRSECAPIVFGSQAPDSGNSEILAHYGTPELKERYLEPLLDNRIVSCFSMTEPQGGADPKVFTTEAVQDGNQWVINGEKWYSSFASMASFIIVMAMTDPDAPPYQRYSMFVVPGDTPGINVLRDVGLGYQPLGGGGREGYVRYENVRVPDDHMLGPRGGAFVVAQTRLGGGRIHHAMRTVGLVRRIFDMLTERAVSRYTQGEVLANKQMVQEMIADSWMEIEAFRLLTLQTAWKIDQYNDYKAVRADISAVKAMMQKVLHDVSARALQLHGSLGTSHEMPFVQYLTESFVLGLADGPTEVHKATLARLLLKDVKPAPDVFPSEHLLRLREAAETEVRRQAGWDTADVTKEGPLLCDGKVALVTGTSRGLGKAIAQRLAREGATVALTARTMEPDPKYQGSLRQTLAEIEAAGGAGVAIQADLSSAQDRERLFAEVVERVGAPDILVNNAAVTFLRPLDEFPERRVRLMMEMHVLAPLHLTQLAIPAMRERGCGWVLNVTSVGGDLPAGPPFSEFDRAAGFGVYGTVKAALNRLTKSLAAELYDDGIAVNAAAPTNPVATPGAGTLDLAKTDTEDIELITRTALLLCTGDPKTLTGRIAHTQEFLREVGLST